MTTASEIVRGSLRDAGIIGLGQIPSAMDINSAMQRLNGMIAQWNRKRWFIWHLIDLSIVSTGAQSYSVGVGGDIATTAPRPDRLEDAYLRQFGTGSNPVDYPLRILQAREDYDKIALKNLTAFPYNIFYDSAFPLGFVFPWPIPTASIYELHIIVKDTLAKFTSQNQILATTDEYSEAMHWNLARRLRAGYRLPADPEINGLAAESLQVLRKANTQVPQLQMPKELLRPGFYNVYADQNY